MGKIMYKGQEFQGKIERSENTEYIPYVLEWDFTKSQFDKRHSLIADIEQVNIDNDGAILTTDESRIIFPLDYFKIGTEIEFFVTYDSKVPQSQTYYILLDALRTVADSSGNFGLMYSVSEGKWGWYAPGGFDFINEATNVDYFNNSVIRVSISNDYKAKVYKNDVLVLEATRSLNSDTKLFMIGSKVNSHRTLYDMTIPWAKIYLEQFNKEDT